MSLPTSHLLLSLPLCACSYAAYTPPSRTMPLETAAAPTQGRSDLQLEANTVGAVMGFDTTNGAARLRHGVTEHVAVSAEGGLLHVNGGGGQVDPNAYLGRVGVHVHSAQRPRIAMTGGVGSGRSSVAGSWVTADVGLVASTETYHFVPFASIEVFGAQPMDAAPFTYPTEAGDPQTDQLEPTRGARGTVGFEWRPGEAGPDSRTSMLLGFSYGGIADADGGDEVFGLGAGLKVKLD